MLNTIKGIINQKKDFLEAAEIILEDGMGSSLDDLIILGEEGDVSPEEAPAVTENDEPEVDDPKGEEPPEGDKPDEDETDITDQPIDDGGVSPAEGPTDDSMENEPIGGSEEPLPIPGSDPLPEPVSKVTGEPVADDNLLTMELDLGTNTPKDVLPVPPNNAGDAVAGEDDSIVNQRIDSGFGGEEGEPGVSDQPGVEPPVTENDELDTGDMLSEAISLDGSGDAGGAEEIPPAEGAPAEGGTEEPAPAEEPAPVEGEGDNEVTAAVKDKVAEADSPAYDGNSENAKEELMKKLSSITKSLEDAKRAVMSAI